VKPAPLRLEPIFSPRLWGSRSLAPLFPEKSNLKEPLGEAWLSGVDCNVASEPCKGKTLAEAWKQMPPEWRGTRLASRDDFPILVKFIFPKDKLSIQVHPDDAYAAAHEQAAGGRGKTEMWHALAAEPGAQVLLGLKPGVDKEIFRKSIAQGKAEDLFRAHPVQAGDTIFVPAGTPHSIGPGMTLCEVQEYSDLTYRVYDYDRLDSRGKARELHLEKALAVMTFVPTIPGQTRHVLLPPELSARSLLAACPYFAAELLQTSLFPGHTTGLHFELLVILSGTGILDGPGFAFPYRPGDCWFLPANLGRYYLAGSQVLLEQGQHEQHPNPDPTTILRAYVPDLAALKAEIGVESPSALARTIFE
jgi:mannose-6-phosphate isomerase